MLPASQGVRRTSMVWRSLLPRNVPRRALLALAVAVLLVLATSALAVAIAFRPHAAHVKVAMSQTVNGTSASPTHTATPLPTPTQRAGGRATPPHSTRRVPPGLPPHFRFVVID